MTNRWKQVENALDRSHSGIIRNLFALSKLDVRSKLPDVVVLGGKVGLAGVHGLKYSRLSLLGVYGGLKTGLD